MAARELGIWQGRLVQPTADTDVNSEFRIKRSGRRAIQIYGFDFNVDSSILSGVVTPFSITAQLRADNDVSTTGEVIIAEYTAMYQTAIGNDAGFFKFAENWRAPPTFVVSKDYMRVVLMSNASGIANEMLFTVHFKAKVITDLEDMQLRLML